MPETLNGFIERVTYHNPENGFAVLRVKVKGHDQLVCVVGSTTSVTAGEHVEASGRWVIDRQHGQQFKADQLKTTHPASAEGIEKYLASGEQKIVEDAVRSVVQVGTVVREAVDGEPWLYLAGLYRAEVGLAQSIHRIASAMPHPLPPIDVKKAIAWVEPRLGIQLAAAQQEAIRQACRHKLLVITGGPGVGKTTLVRSILEILNRASQSAGMPPFPVALPTIPPVIAAVVSASPPQRIAAVTAARKSPFAVRPGDFSVHSTPNSVQPGRFLDSGRPVSRTLSSICPPIRLAISVVMRRARLLTGSQ